MCPAAPSGLHNGVISNKQTGSVSTERAALAKIHIFHISIKKSKVQTFLNIRKAFSGAQVSPKPRKKVA